MIPDPPPLEREIDLGEVAIIGGGKYIPEENPGLEELRREFGIKSADRVEHARQNPSNILHSTAPTRSWDTSVHPTALGTTPVFYGMYRPMGIV